MSDNKVIPGNAVRFIKCGAVGVVDDVEGSEADVWVLEWVARTPPVLVRRRCSLESIRRIPDIKLTTGEERHTVSPHTCYPPADKGFNTRIY